MRARAVDAQITAGAGESRATLLDLNDRDPLYVLHDGFTLGTSGREDRTATLVVRGRGSTSAIPRKVSALVRAFNHPESHLLWQAMPSHAKTWWRILDTVSEMNFSQTVVTDDTREPMWTLQVSLTIEPLGYGEEVTLDPITVTNAAIGFTIPDEIAGDAPTLAKVSVKPGASLAWGYWENLLSVIPVLHSCSLGSPAGVSEATPIPAAIQWEAESFTLAGDATTTTSSALSGNSGVVIPEANTAWRQVLYGPVPVKPPPGRYAVFLRVSRSAHAGKMRFRVGHSGWQMASTLTDDAPLYAPVGAVADSAWMRLGELSFPAGQPFSGLTEADITTPTIQLYAKGLAAGGGSNIIADRFVLVPLELSQGGQARTRRGLWGINGPLGPGPLWNSWCMDGLRRRDGLVRYDGVWYSSAQPALPGGGYILLHPGMRNVGVLLSKVHNGGGGGPGVETLTDTAEVTFSYHPRIEHLASS